MVVGDGKGRVGTGHAKAKEVPEAIRKATEQAKRNMIRVPLREGRTIHHDISARFGAGKVIMRSAPGGTGVIAGGPMRAVFDCVGIQDIVAKAVGSSNPYNMVNATLAALEKMESPRQIAARRGKKVSDIVAARETARGGKASAQEETKGDKA
jgi:small subunit ribosomal protein S5